MTWLMQQFSRQSLLSSHSSLKVSFMIPFQLSPGHKKYAIMEQLSASDTCGYSEECKECHSECSKVCMLPQTLTWVLVITAEAAKHLNTQGRENKEQKEEEKALEEVVYYILLGPLNREAFKLWNIFTLWSDPPTTYREKKHFFFWR